ncbi:MAG TPA: flippase [Thermoleophilaceae bacterium]|nr:flippase [Thermoleophilaceae bacterium]
MADEPQDRTAGEEKADRVAHNTAVRAIGEIVGKLASLVLFAALAREVGAHDLGAFVFALAWAQLATIPIDLGFDWYVVRTISRDKSKLEELFFNTFALKLRRAAVVTVVSFALISVLDYDEQTRLAVYLLTAGTLLDSLSQTVFAVFNAHERGYLAGIALVVQRVGAAGLGLVALYLGGDVVAVSATFSIGTAVGFVVALVLMARKIGMPARTFPREGREGLKRTSRSYGAQDVLGVVLAKLDVVLLSLLATGAAIGRYGAAYRLLEATFFFVSAISGAFVAMYSYLTLDSEPTVKSVFGHSIKLALVGLVPCGVVFAVLADPLARVIFGDDLAGAADPLRLLGPTAVLLGIITLGSSLLIGRREPHVIVRLAAGAVAINVALNLILIPPYEDQGAAAAMVATGVVFTALVLFEASRTVGGMDWRATFAGPLLAGTAMTAVMVPLSGSLLPALAAGVPAYVLVLWLVERTTNPEDVEFVLSMVRRRLPSPRSA